MTEDDFNLALDKLQADARFGIEMEGFERSPVYHYLVACADRDAYAAAELLVDADPLDAKLVAHLQGEVKRARTFRDWVQRAIDRGNQAHQTLVATEG